MNKHLRPGKVAKREALQAQKPPPSAPLDDQAARVRASTEAWWAKNIAAAHLMDLVGRPINRCDVCDPVVIAHLADRGYDDMSIGPCWQKVYQERDGKKVWLKPHVRCICGSWTGLGLHHVHADGKVTASFFHATAEQLAAMGDAGKGFAPGCGWHVYLKLDGYGSYGEYPPRLETK